MLSKIQRVVFESVHKWDGVKKRELSVSQAKQIAGRAGRYGLNTSSEESGGFVTTLHEEDLLQLRKYLSTPLPALTMARSGFFSEMIEDVATKLPQQSNIDIIFDVFKYISAKRWPYQQQQYSRMDDLMQFVSSNAPDMDIVEQASLIPAPLPWSATSVVNAMGAFLRQVNAVGHVDIIEALSEVGLIKILENMENLRASDPSSSVTHSAMLGLEDMHKAVVLYMWYSQRYSVVYSQLEIAQALKQRVESCLEWAIEGISWVRTQKQHKRERQ